MDTYSVACITTAMRNIVSGLLLLLLCMAAFAGDGRKGEIRLTDGSVYKGEILAKGKLRLVTWAEDELGIDTEEDLEEYATGEDDKYRGFYGKEHLFSLNKVTSIRLEPRPDLASRDKPAERMERKWDWKELARHEDSPQEVNDEKVFIGDPFPVRELQAVVTFNNGATLRGELTKDAVYMYPEGSFTAKKFILRAKERGEEGESLEDLVHVKRIRFLEEGRTFPRSHRVTIQAVKPDRPDAVWAISRETLTRLEPEPAADRDNAVDISGAYGEGMFLAVKHNGSYVVGWNDHADEALWATSRRHLKEMRDYYNERKLLGVHRVGDSNDVLTLVRYRRHVPEMSVREHQPERFGLPADSSLEYWRIGIWRWRHHPNTDEMILVNRGSFFRKQLPERGMETPEVRTTPKLWMDRKQDLPRRFTVGETTTSGQ